MWLSFLDLGKGTMSDQSEISYSRCICSTIELMAALHLSRSARPNLIPLIVQFAPPGDFGEERCNTTPTKASQLGSEGLTPVAIADSRNFRPIEVRGAARPGSKLMVLMPSQLIRSTEESSISQTMVRRKMNFELNVVCS